MTLGMNGIIQGLTLGRHHGLTCGGVRQPARRGAGQRHDRQVLGIDTSLLIWLVVIVIVSFTLSFTTFGRRVYAVGNTERVFTSRVSMSRRLRSPCTR